MTPLGTSLDLDLVRCAGFSSYLPFKMLADTYCFDCCTGKKVYIVYQEPVPQRC